MLDTDSNFILISPVIMNPLCLLKRHLVLFQITYFHPHTVNHIHAVHLSVYMGIVTKAPCTLTRKHIKIRDKQHPSMVTLKDIFTFREKNLKRERTNHQIVKQ